MLVFLLTDNILTEEKLMSVLLILVGAVLGGWAGANSTKIESQRAVIFTGPIGVTLMTVFSFGGFGLFVWGIISLFS